ncbi:MAG: hypothetical protein VX438_17655 [Planctomycetota bacterium]|jgi:hypothetical protein|nr:hypothetical protein [Planctomycetota bacterium]
MPNCSRKIDGIYEDPLDLIWKSAARAIGIQVKRDDQVFASWDGDGMLRVGLESLDPDDCLAQMVLHELCHALVEGPDSHGKPDWGLNDDLPKTRDHEFATLRLQACLADHVGMRFFFAATTDHREYYDLIPIEPFEPIELDRHKSMLIRPITLPEDQTAIELGQLAFASFQLSTWKNPILDALESTRKILDVVQGYTPLDSIWRTSLRD